MGQVVNMFEFVQRSVYRCVSALLVPVVLQTLPVRDQIASLSGTTALFESLTMSNCAESETGPCILGIPCHTSGNDDTMVLLHHTTRCGKHSSDF